MKKITLLIIAIAIIATGCDNGLPIENEKPCYIMFNQNGHTFIDNYCDDDPAWHSNECTCKFNANKPEGGGK